MHPERTIPRQELRYLLKVIGAGYSRTGTLSLKRALEILGVGRCYHFTEVLKRRHATHWLDILDGGPQDWDAIFDGYGATVDWPAVTYYRELADYYPNAKVILTTRDPEQWHASISKALLPLRQVLPSWLPWASRIRRLTDLTIWQGTFEGRVEDREFATACLRHHSQEVTAAIDSQRLLVFDVRQGWNPLCEFLQCPVPDVPFPRTNSRRSIHAAVWAIRCLKWLIVATVIVAVVAVTTWVTR